MTKVNLYTSKALAEKLGLSYKYLRVALSKHKGDTFRGYKLFGGSGHPWYAYDPKEVDIEVL